MFTIISLAIALAVAAVGYLQARSFVRSKLRFVDAVQHFAAPLLAGVAAMLIAAPVVWLLPLIGKGTALLFGLGVGSLDGIDRDEWRTEIESQGELFDKLDATMPAALRLERQLLQAKL